MPAAASSETAQDDRQPAPPAGAAAVRRGAGPRHQKKEEHVVDGHDRADGGAVVAEHIADERRDEVAQQRTGDAGEQAAQPDNQAGLVGMGA